MIRLAEVYYNQGRFQSSIDAYHLLIQLNPESEAKVMYQRVLDIDPNGKHTQEAKTAIEEANKK